jgi:hypothetical protein
MDNVLLCVLTENPANSIIITTLYNNENVLSNFVFGSFCVWFRMDSFCNIAGNSADSAGIVAQTAATNGNFTNVAANESSSLAPNATTINL